MQSSQNKNETPIINKISIFLSTINGFTIALKPMPRVIFVILLPIMFPIETPTEPLAIAIKLTKNSGAEVANARIVRPTIIGRIEKESAKADVPFTSQLEPAHKRVIPNNKANIL